MASYYAYFDRSEHGPWSLSQLVASRAGKDTYCWRAGLADWLPAVEIPELAEYLAHRAERPPLSNMFEVEDRRKAEALLTLKQSPLGILSIAGCLTSLIVFGVALSWCLLPVSNTRLGQETVVSVAWISTSIGLGVLLLSMTLGLLGLFDSSRRRSLCVVGTIASTVLFLGWLFLFFQLYSQGYI